MRRKAGETFRSAPKLLVSVRNAQEGADALAGGADIIDVKEPSRGSLGAADQEHVEQVVRQVGTKRPVSMAGGELLDLTTVEVAVPNGVQFVKYGLARCAGNDNWQENLVQIQDRLPDDIQIVPVAYGDWRMAQAPEPWEVLRCADELGCRTLLIDTYIKCDRELFDCWSFAEVAAFVRTAQASGMAVALAGGLHDKSLVKAVDTGADIIGVRGAACATGRVGRLQVDRVRFVRRIVVRTASLPFVPVN